MFGLFGKKELENSTFNSALIASISDSVRKSGRFPTESELITAVTDLTKSHKITSAQINSIRTCALSINGFSWAENELMPLIRKMQKEYLQLHILQVITISNASE